MALSSCTRCSAHLSRKPSRSRWIVANSLAQAVARLAPCSLVLVEGYKTHPIPKLEVWRPSVGKPVLHGDDPHILAVATDAADALPACPLPVFALSAIDEIATFVLHSAADWPVAD